MNEPTEIYYVVLRGAGRQPIFMNDDDRTHFTSVVAQSAASCGVTVFAYCWLVTEARLAVRISDISISRFAQRVAQQHAKRLNRDIPMTGSHFEQKCRGVKVDGQTALVDLVRHLHLAPLKAGLATDAGTYPWSSHRVYLGLEEAPWLAVAPVLMHFAQADGDALLGYTKFMSQGAENIEALATQIEVMSPKVSAAPQARSHKK
jgi:REP element-mobilizing transposase RayT